MRTLNVTERARVLTVLVEGMGINAACRVTGVSKTAVLKLLADVGEACAAYQDRVMRNLSCKRLQCDEIWSFVQKKQRSVKVADKLRGYGDAWTWTAIDPDTKLIPCWQVAPRNARSAKEFIEDLSQRLANRVQLTTDGYKPYLTAVEKAFGSEIDYAMLVKIYGPAPSTSTQEARYSPAKCCGSIRGVVCGNPDEDHISTSHVERANLTMRMHMRRFTRLTNGHSKKLENHMHAVALNFMYYNFCKIHSTLRVTPAMEAKIDDHVWTMEEVVMMADTMG